jgi:hypothetical protein
MSIGTAVAVGVTLGLGAAALGWARDRRKAKQVKPLLPLEPLDPEKLAEGIALYEKTPLNSPDCAPILAALLTNIYITTATSSRRPRCPASTSTSPPSKRLSGSGNRRRASWHAACTTRGYGDDAPLTSSNA